ncbi:MerR family transcriptional regulator [Mycolicibacterium holsaticum]|uniref:MerR family transcriptional regulator n=1 Tax=Mycolicibacterium holsaticum TaxID=152142 RepID=UPI001C7D419E|nr:MerR family transcriptional regulator [Mycolicibacterium holsaticum]MDA4110601.1 MerR family transcriptional regulator [Mycolicibacterium holsaticum DSM 44478 = JCM 12374]QZA14197.1 MerR family transcriptional regulator [Mycolicibacterium holsaticum DSM 44478 = JCM 12374]UNC08348.1 MerR family transcriptional regulator [Mycolicibacterium holsaticum DSM 44478 = JCM 12374]
MAEYRLDELARISGVSARNIRAYRERGLLDPPRRVGRSAFYDDYHLSQLRTINQLHRRGFNSAHIAEFFASMRQGADLADILGIQRAVLGPPDEEGEPSATPTPESGIDVDPGGDEVRRLIEYGLAELVEGAVVLVDPVIGDVVARAADQTAYLRALLRIYETTRPAIANMASGFVEVIDDCVTDTFGPQAPEPEKIGQVAQDYRDMWRRVVAGELDKASRRPQNPTAH